MPRASETDIWTTELTSIAWLFVKVVVFLAFALAPIDVVVIAYQQF